MAEGSCSCSCSCGENTQVRLMQACPGAANTGALSDRVLRTLGNRGAGSASCLAAVGAGLSGFTASAEGADQNIILDGCSVSCGKRIFEQKGLPFTQYVMTDHGVEKGKTAITEAVVDRVAEEICSRIEKGE